MSIYAETRNGEPTGRFRVQVMRDGQRYSAYASSKREAKGIERDLQLGRVAAAGEYSVDDLRRDCAYHWRGAKDPQGMVRFEVAMDALREALQGAPLRSVDLTTIDRWMGLIRARPGVSEVTVNRYLAPLSKALNWADERGKLDRMPRLKKLWAKPVRKPRFSLAENDEANLRTILREQRGDDYVLVLDVQLATGARISEVLGIKPENITHEQGMASSGREASGPGDGLVAAGWTKLTFEDTKDGGYRTVSIPASLGQAFALLVGRGLPSYPAVRRAFVRARRGAGLPTAQPTHANRRTTITRLTAKGVPTLTVQRLVGHSSPTTTALYNEGDEGAQRAAVSLMVPSIRPADYPSQDMGSSALPLGQS